jgi:hypothetical protein
MFDISVTRFAGGLTNVRDQGIFSDLYVPDRIGKVHEYSNDFDQFIAADWVNTGAGTAVLVAGDGGNLAITSAVSAFQSVQKTPAAWQTQKNFRTWGRFSGSLDSLLGNVLLGLLNVTVTPFTGASQTDGMYFTSAVGTGALSFNIAVGGVITTVAVGASIVAGAVPANQFNLLFYWDGGVYAAAPNGRVVFEASGPGIIATGVGASGSVRGEIALPAGTTFPGNTLTVPTMAVSASTAVARLLTMSGLYVAKDNTNINATPGF